MKKIVFILNLALIAVSCFVIWKAKQLHPSSFLSKQTHLEYPKE